MIWKDRRIDYVFAVSAVFLELMEWTATLTRIFGKNVAADCGMWYYRKRNLRDDYYVCRR